MDRLQTSNQSSSISRMGRQSNETNRNTHHQSRELNEVMAGKSGQKNQDMCQNQDLSSLFSNFNSSITPGWGVGTGLNGAIHELYAEIPSNSQTTSAAQLTPGKLPSTENMKESDKFDLYSDIISKHGSDEVKEKITNGEKVALSLRAETDTSVNEGKGEYDDRMVLIWKDTQGVKHVNEYEANLDPSGQYEHNGEYSRKSVGVDYNGDGRLDQGRLAEGTYNYTKGTFLNKTAFRSTGDQVTERDVDHNGKFDDNATSSKGNYKMHIHIGGESNTYSAGCFTLPPDEHSNFFKDVGNQSTLTNVVVDTKSFSGPAEAE